MKQKRIFLGLLACTLLAPGAMAAHKTKIECKGGYSEGHLFMESITDQPIANTRIRIGITPGDENVLQKFNLPTAQGYWMEGYASCAHSPSDPVIARCTFIQGSNVTLTGMRDGERYSKTTDSIYLILSDVIEQTLNGTKAYRRNRMIITFQEDFGFYAPDYHYVSNETFTRGGCRILN